ncbi:uncharacterized protein LOC144797813 isoform X2 [Lissotriton helveticus]
MEQTPGIELQEAAELLTRLNQNLAYWAEKTGEVEKLALVWATFQNQLSVLSGFVAGPSEQADLMDESTEMSASHAETLQ